MTAQDEAFSATTADGSVDPERPPLTESLGGPGGLILLLGTLAVMLYAFLAKVVDGRVESTDSVGRTVVYEGGGNSAGLVAALCLFLAACVALSQILSWRFPRARIGSAFGWSALFLVGWWGLVTLVRGDGAATLLSGPIIGAVLLVGVITTPPTLALMSALNWVRDAMVVGSILFSLLSPQYGQAECRADKCGLFGSMWTGLFPNENAASAQLLLLAPALVVASRTRLLISASLLTVLILGAGSRTSLAAWFLGLVVILYLRRRIGVDGEANAPLALRAVPLASLGLSGLIFWQAHDDDLSGRGHIYDFIKDKLAYASDLVLGPGPDAMEGVLGGFVVTEHGQVPYLLVNQGLPGLVIFTCALACLLLPLRGTAAAVAVVAVVIASARFATEVGMPLNPRTMEFVVLLWAVGLIAHSARTRGRDTYPSETTSNASS